MLFRSDRRLYDLFVRLKATEQPVEVQRLIAKTIEDFQRVGVDKDEATRARIRAISDELVEVAQQFTKGIASDVRSIELDPARLKGMPEDWVRQHPPCPADAAKGSCTPGKVRVTTNYPDYNPFMAYADDDAARKALFIEFRLRGWPDRKSTRLNSSHT